jgi:hypothetical protein
MSDFIHVGDEGTVLTKTVVDQDSVVVDLSTATSIVLVVCDAGGNRSEITGAFPAGGDGTDGIVEFTTVSTTWQVDGVAREQVQIVDPAGSWSSNSLSRDIYPKL